MEKRRISQRSKATALESFINTNANVILPQLFKIIATLQSLKKNALVCISYLKDEFEFGLNT